jgi:phage shock protein C
MAEGARYCTSCGKPADAPAGVSVATVGPAPRRLRRIISQKKIAGVCAGFAEYFDMDITLMRVIWLALLLLPPGIGLFGYIVAWAVMPKE